MNLSILNRRGFLKASAITGAAVALNEATGGLIKTAAAESFVDENVTGKLADDEKIVKTCCRACIHNCAVLAHVRNGRIVKLEGNPEFPMTHGAMCAKGLSGMTAVYHPNRNKYPLLRVGERGENKWKRISWKEAVDLVAHKCVDATNNYGAETIIVSTGGGGNPAFRGVRRVANALGTPNFFEPGCAQCYLPRTLAFGLQYGGPSTSIADESCLELYNPDTEIKCLVCWGTDPSYSCPGGGGRVMSDLRAKGMKTIAIDPRFGPDASKADIWLPIRPGTDVALMLCWIRYIIEKELYDKEFCMKWTNLPYLVDDSKFTIKAKDMFGEGAPQDRVVWDAKTNSPKPLPYPWDDNLDPVLDGEFEWEGKKFKTAFRLLKERAEEWTIEAAAKECWLDPKKIEEAILMYCENTPGGMSLGVATDQFPNSVEAAMGSVIINGLVGNVECPGALLQRNPSSDVVPAGSLCTACPYLLPKGQLKKRLGGMQHKGLYQWDAAQPKAVRDAMATGKPYQPRVWLERSGNKYGVLANSTEWQEAAKHVDFIVHMFLYPTTFSMNADLLMPATEWLETNMLIQNLNMVFARQPVTHLWQTQDETMFWSWLVRRCAELGHENAKRACDPKFMTKDPPYWHDMEELLDNNLKKINLTWKQLLANNPFTYMPYDKWNTYYVYKKIDPKTNKPVGFGTPTKKYEIYGDCYITLGRTGKPYALDDDGIVPAVPDYDPLPFYMVPAENPYNEYGEKYPLVMTNGRLPMYHHGTLRNAPFLREIYPVPETWVNPVDAEKYGVKHGQWIWVESARQRTHGLCRVTEGIPIGVVYQERFWTPETLYTPTKGYLECNVNILSRSDPPYNEKVGTYTLRGYQVKIYPAEGAPKGVWTKPEDFKPWLPQPTAPTPTPNAEDE